MSMLKEQMVDWLLDAVGNDVEAPKRLHELLKSNNATKSELHDAPTANRKIFLAFVALLVPSWKLPSKKAVRRKAGLGDDPSGRATAAAAFKILGLSGLPGG